MNYKGIKIFPKQKIALIVPLKCASRSVTEAIRQSELTWESVSVSQFIMLSDHYLTFAFVRNPWDRLVSFWAGNIYQDDIDNCFKLLGFWSRMSFKSTLDIICEDVQKNPHYAPQWDLVTGQGNWKPNFTGHFETLDNNWVLVQQCLNVPDLEKLNTSEHGKAEDYYTEKMKNKVAHYYEKDLRLMQR